MAKKQTDGTKTIATNRRARFDYELTDSYEAGLQLLGSEVKSLRAGKANLGDAYGFVRRNEVWVAGMHIAPYDFAHEGGHDPTRERKLLLHRHEIERIASGLAEKGLTLIPTRLYFKHGKAKIEIALAKGKARYDKRETIKRRQADREMDRAMRHRSID